MILVYFASGGCVNDVVDNRTNHQFTSLLHYFITSFFMNSTKVCWIIKRTVLMCTSA